MGCKNNPNTLAKETVKKANIIRFQPFIKPIRAIIFGFSGMEVFLAEVERSIIVEEVNLLVIFSEVKVEVFFSFSNLKGNLTVAVS